MSDTTHKIIIGECLKVLRSMPENSVDLVITSPPYEDARAYEIGFDLHGEAWVRWCLERYLECVRVSRGLVCWVVEGRTRNYRWSASPVKLMADLDRAGVCLRKPPIFNRIGIPGSGGPDWWRNDYEFCICSTKGRLPWSNNTATGHIPKWAPGGAMSHRLSNGERRNEFGGTQPTTERRPNGDRHKRTHTKTRRRAGTDVMEVQAYAPPKIANPGNIVRCKVGGGLMGHPLAHQNEAPFPESLIDPFIVSFCPPGGMVLDPFAGSGTSIAVAKKRGRNGIGIELRKSQAMIARRLIEEVSFDSFTFERQT